MDCKFVLPWPHGLVAVQDEALAWIAGQLVNGDLNQIESTNRIHLLYRHPIFLLISRIISPHLHAS